MQEERVAGIDAVAERLIASSPAVHYVAKPGDGYETTFVGGGVEVQTGYEPDCFVRDSAFWKMRIHPDDRARVLADRERIGENGSCQHEYRFRHADGLNAGHTNPIVLKDGTSRQIEWHAKTLTDESGQIIGLLNIGHDVTERIEREDAMKRARQEAEQANRVKSRFLATASHDLRQPLHSLASLNSSLQKIVSTPQAARMLAMQERALSGMSHLLDSLLHITKLESGSIKPAIADWHVQDVLDLMEAHFAEQAREKGLEFVVERATETIRTDRDLLTQLLQNLVANAVRYTDEGGIRVRCTAEPERVKIAVRDTGPGIPQAEIESIFHEFYQIDRDQFERRGGVGLGLSIASRIADLLDVTITVSSELGRGSTFSVLVPYGVASADRAESRRQGAAAASRVGTVLLVDDDSAVLASSQILLELEGFHVICASSPAEAYARVQEAGSLPDVIITDYHLSRIEKGTDVIDTIRRQLDRRVPAIVLTGDTSPFLSGLEMEKVSVLSKPLQATELLSTVRDTLQETHEEAGRDSRAQPPREA